jgi:hypothetical protein
VGFTLPFALQLRKKARKNLSQGSHTYHFVPLETYDMWEASWSESIARQLHFLPHFPASSNTVLLQACFGLHLFLGSCRFQSNVCF